ncbi:MAG: hypothetical protein NVS1B13_23260 [Flavisolibacter sp.]
MSGRVTDINVNPSNTIEFYAAFASGGLWYTDNNGQSFQPVFDSADVLSIGAIAVNWKTGTLWVGTGEANSSRSSYAGTGIYLSPDKGKTWLYKGLPESHHIGKILLDPTNENIIWVAVLGHLYSSNPERGVYKTTNGGTTWIKSLYIDDNTGVVDLDINPLNPQEIFAAAWYRTRKAWSFEGSGKTSGIYKTSDGGLHWVLLTKEGSGFPSGNICGRIGICIYPKNPLIVYAVLDNQTLWPDSTKKDTSKYQLNDFKAITKEQFNQLQEKKLDSFFYSNAIGKGYTVLQVKNLIQTGQLKPTAVYDYLYRNEGLQEKPNGCEIYRSDNGGFSWKKMNSTHLSLYNTYGYYFGKIFISPYDDQKLVITGYTIEMSRDGGKTFTAIGKENVHADHHIAWIDPANDAHLIIGNDGGCNISYDQGAHWFKANTPAVGQFYSVFADNAQPYNVYGGLQDNGVWYGPSSNKENYSWYSSGENPYKNIMGGDGMQVQVDTRDNTTVYTGFQFGNYSRLNRNAPTKTAKSIRPPPLLGEKPYRFNWQSPVLISSFNQDVLYFGGNKLFRSLNRGDTMVAISGDLSKGERQGNVPFGTITTIAESPFRFGLLYTGTDDGNIHCSKDAGYNWTLLNPNEAKNKAVIPAGLWVNRIVASRFKEGRVFVALSGYRNDDFLPYLYVSDDFGETWKALGKDLPAEPINCIREDPKSENILYVGTDGGLFASFDRGKNFMSWNAGLPRSVPVHDIAIQPRENEIIIGTHGRSIYVAKLEEVQGLQNDTDYLKKKPKKESEKNKSFHFVPIN